MKIKVDITLDKLGKFTKAISDLAKQQVLVGIPAVQTDRDADDGPITNAALGYIHENGAPEAGIPPRPFLVPGIKDQEPAIIKYLEQAATAATEGRQDVMQKALNAAGDRAQLGAKNKINSNIAPALKEDTIKARVRRGVTRTNTLIDTGALRNAITFVIRKT